MAKKKADQGWSPYLAGALAGLLAVGSAYVTTKVMGETARLETSATFVRISGLMEQKVWPEHVARSGLFQKVAMKADWQLMLACGIFLGALAGALTGRSFAWEGVPPTWEKRFGRNPLYRGACAFAGGAVTLFGACLANGGLGGHGLCGTMQLSVSSMGALACFFIGGIVVARMMYRKGDPYE
jgi:hypothetical protein